MPHARVRDIDASAALAMDGVVAVLTADEVPEVQAPAGPDPDERRHTTSGADPRGRCGRRDTRRGCDREAIKVDLELLPFTVDPLRASVPKGPDARLDGNVMVPREGLGRFKWTEEDFAAADDGELPMGEPTSSGRTATSRAGFAKAAVVPSMRRS